MIYYTYLNWLLLSLDPQQKVTSTSISHVRPWFCQQARRYLLGWWPKGIWALVGLQEIGGPRIWSNRMTPEKLNVCHCSHREEYSTHVAERDFPRVLTNNMSYSKDCFHYPHLSTVSVWRGQTTMKHSDRCDTCASAGSEPKTVGLDRKTRCWRNAMLSTTLMGRMYPDGECVFLCNHMDVQFDQHDERSVFVTNLGIKNNAAERLICVGNAVQHCKAPLVWYTCILKTHDIQVACGSIVKFHVLQHRLVCSPCKFLWERYVKYLLFMGSLFEPESTSLSQPHQVDYSWNTKIPMALRSCSDIFYILLCNLCIRTYKGSLKYLHTKTIYTKNLMFLMILV